jgi:hypothetical protein
MRMSARARAVAGLAVIVAGGLVGGAAYALDQATSEDLPVAPASPTPSPTPSETESETSTPAPAPTTPRPTPSATPTATQKPSASASPSPAPKLYAYPGPTTAYPPLTLRAEINPQAGTTSQTFTLEGVAKDGDGTIFVSSVNWGDGTVNGGEAGPTSCPAYPSPTAAPGPYQPHGDSRTFTRTHTYSAIGDYKVVVTVRSINADCRPHGPRAEVATVTFDGASRIHVA